MWHFCSPLGCQNWEPVHNWDVLGILGWARVCENRQATWSSHQPQTLQWPGEMWRKAYWGKISTNMQLFILDYGFTSWERCGLWSQSLFSKHIKQIQQIQQQSPGFLSIFHHICIIKSKLQYLYLCFLRPFKNRSAFPFHSRLRQGHINCTANHVPRHLLNKSWGMEE